MERETEVGTGMQGSLHAFLGWLIPQICILQPLEASAWITGCQGGSMTESCTPALASHPYVATEPHANDHEETRNIPEVFPSRLPSLSPWKR